MIGRQDAHDAGYDAAQASFLEGRPFGEALAEVDEVTKHMTTQQIEAMLDPTKYTGVCSIFAERGAKRAREVASELNG